MTILWAILLASSSGVTSDIHLIGHRGGVVDEQRPENTLSSQEEAIHRQYWMVEIDVRKSKDGELVLSHDDNFNQRISSICRSEGIHEPQLPSAISPANGFPPGVGEK